MTYDPTKEYQTRDGREVMLLPELDWEGDVHGMYRDDDGNWRGAVWWNGETLKRISGKTDLLDLVEKPKTHTVWVYMIERNDGSRYYYADSMRFTSSGAIKSSSTIKSIARLEMTEGDGLEDE
jgi:hypothetical protein